MGSWAADSHHPPHRFGVRPWVAALLVVLAGAAAGCGSSSDSGPPAVSTQVTAAAALVTPSPEPSPTSPGPVTIVAVGDIMLARSVGQRILSAGAGIVFDDGIAATLRGADLTIGNLEFVISERGEAQPKGYTFRAGPEVVEALALGGFDAVSLANNHANDFGADALSDTVAHLAERQIASVGAGSNLAAASAPAVIERNGLRIAVVGLTDVPSEGPGFSRQTWEAGPDRWGVAWADAETVGAAVRTAGKGTDVVVAMLHFGFEYHEAPSDSQRTLARAAIDAGASLVIGSHPHVLQEVEEYGGGLIAYSLGNFVFDGFDGDANTSAILRVTLDGDGIHGWEMLPVEIVDNGLPRLAGQ